MTNINTIHSMNNSEKTALLIGAIVLTCIVLIPLSACIITYKYLK
jgi:hypothetical protein